nr:MAG TPA: hypothetical protein [Caudoviricetes sp.]
MFLVVAHLFSSFRDLCFLCRKIYFHVEISSNKKQVL